MEVGTAGRTTRWRPPPIPRAAPRHRLGQRPRPVPVCGCPAPLGGPSGNGQRRRSAALPHRLRCHSTSTLLLPRSCASRPPGPTAAQPANSYPVGAGGARAAGQKEPGRLATARAGHERRLRVPGRRGHGLGPPAAPCRSGPAGRLLPDGGDKAPSCLNGSRYETSRPAGVSGKCEMEASTTVRSMLLVICIARGRTPGSVQDPECAGRPGPRSSSPPRTGAPECARGRPAIPQPGVSNAVVGLSVHALCESFTRGSFPVRHPSRRHSEPGAGCSAPEGLGSARRIDDRTSTASPLRRVANARPPQGGQERGMDGTKGGMTKDSPKGRRRAPQRRPRRVV